MLKGRATHDSSIIDARWVVAVRLCIAVTALLSVTTATFLGQPETAERVRFLYTGVAALFLLNAISALWLHFARPGRIFYVTHVAIDIPLVTGVVYTTGGGGSPFVFLYMLLVMVAGALVSGRAALLVAVASAAAYSLLLAILRADFIPAADGTHQTSLTLVGIGAQGIGLTAAMILVALGTSFLRARLLSSYQLVEESRQSLIVMSSEQSEMFDRFPGGIIATDINMAVKTINQAARTMLQIGSVPERQLSLKAIFEASGQPFEKLTQLLEGEIEVTELEIQTADTNGPNRVQVHRKATRDALGTITGITLFLTDVTELRSAEEKLALQERMAQLLSDQAAKTSVAAPLGDLIGESQIMQKVFDIIQRVSGAEATVLVTGESGTGKELVARAIHFNSPRKNQPFVAVNCGAIPENLIESELFGHKKGSFTGADHDTIGLFRQAHSGTLFLDEIGELPLLMQAKLLRSLQEKTVRPVGATTDIPVDVRIVAATNRNLKREVEAGRFREDLYYRLNVIGVHIPPLRERRDDIPLLIQSTLRRLSKGRPSPVVSPGALSLLVSYEYPGNVRELENLLERAMVLGGDAILPEHLPELARSQTGAPLIRSGITETEIIEVPSISLPVDLDTLLASLERRYLERALEQTSGAKKQAAALLGLNFRSFRYRLQKFGMASDQSGND